MSHDDAYRAVLDELARLTEAWRIHREVVNRAINALNHEVLAFTDRLDKDDAQRVIRQKDLDSHLGRIHRWQWLRIGIDIGMAMLVLVVLIALWITR